MKETQIYKFCNYKNNNDFNKLTTYNIDNKQYHVYGKKRERLIMKINMNSLLQLMKNYFLEHCV